MIIRKDAKMNMEFVTTTWYLFWIPVARFDQFVGR